MMQLIVVHLPIGPPFVGVTLDGILALSKTLPFFPIGKEVADSDC
jgi:hypothetical protein